MLANRRTNRTENGASMGWTLALAVLASLILVLLQPGPANAASLVQSPQENPSHQPSLLASSPVDQGQVPAARPSVKVGTLASKAKNVTGKANVKRLLRYTATESCWQKARTYTAYDVTGDKKPDKLRIVATANDSDMMMNLDSVVVYVNGKRLKTLRNNRDDYYSRDGCAIDLLTLSNGKSFLYVSMRGRKSYAERSLGYILQCSKSKAKVVMSPDTCVSDFYPFHTQSSKPSGNQIRVIFDMNYGFAGYSKMRFDYSWSKKKGTLVRKPNATWVRYWNLSKKLGTWSLKATQSFDVYASTEVAKNTFTESDSRRAKKAFTVPRGKQVKIVGATMKDGSLLFKVRYGQLQGWVLDNGGQYIGKYNALR